MAPRPPACVEIQARVLKWLSTDLDLQDFPIYLIAEWAEENEIDGVREDAYVDDLTPAQQAAFTAWLAGEVPRLMATDPLELPAYLTLHAERTAPPGTWFAHFTREPGGFHMTIVDGEVVATHYYSFEAVPARAIELVSPAGRSQPSGRARRRR